MNEWMDRWMYMYGWMSGWMDGWMSDWIDTEWMEVFTKWFESVFIGLKL